jgi:hypothetical protein
VKHNRLNRWQCSTVFTIMVLCVLLSGYDIMAKPYPSFFRGVRPLGMGNAFIAVADDENALFYNPAGLSRTERVNVGIFNPVFEISDKMIDLISDAQDADLDDTGEVADLLRKYIGEHQHFSAALYPYVGFNVADVGVMVAGLGQGTINADIRNPVWPEAHVDMISDYGVIGGAGLKIPFEKLVGLRAGAALKLISRQSLSEVYTATDLADPDFSDRLDDDLVSGSGISLDLGAIYTLPFVPVVDTNVALVIQNIPEMDMGDAEDIKTQFHLGVGVEKDFKAFKLIGALDYRDITGNIGEDNDIAKRLHLGAEAKLIKILAVRAGFNQGYISAGTTIDIWVVKFDFATYAEEVGAYAGQRMDRRYAFQITLGW